MSLGSRLSVDRSVSRRKSLALSLYHSILKKDYCRIEYLLKNEGADPNFLLPQFGVSPMHCTVGCGREDHAFRVVSLALTFGGDPNIPCSEGATPVLVAASWGRINILKLLLAHGGNPFLCDDYGFNAFDHSSQNGHKYVDDYLKSWARHDKNFLSPTQSDAITQTSLISLEHNQTISDDLTDEEFVSCPEEVCSRNETCVESDLQNNCSTLPNSTYNSPNSCTSSKLNSFDTNSRPLLHEKAFICDNLSDLLSDIDLDLDIQQTESIFNSKDNSVALEDVEGRLIVNETLPSFEDLSVSYSQKDIAFTDALPNALSKPTEELYTDDEAGVVLLQRKFPPDLSESEVSDGPKVSGNSTEYDTDNLTNRLKECKIFSGPVTKTTKRVYTRQLKRFVKSENTEKEKEKCKYGVNSVLSRTFSDNLVSLINQWAPLEVQMSQDFLKNPSNNKFRGGVAKCFFNYLLLDPRITDNLPARANHMNSLDAWKTFIDALFYIGKGKQSRPYAHLYEALKPSTRRPPSKKVEKVLDIWKDKHGVVCLMIFHNLISAEALTREAAMIDVLEGGHLTNAQGGEYHGIAASWNMKQKCQLGAVLLYRALQIFLAEGERHIAPPDLEERPRFR